MASALFGHREVFTHQLVSEPGITVPAAGAEDGGDAAPDASADGDGVGNLNEGAGAGAVAGGVSIVCSIRAELESGTELATTGFSSRRRLQDQPRQSPQEPAELYRQRFSRCCWRLA